jgi:very-short-patch-repair endonuclease
MIARRLRKAMTRAEVALWKRLRGRGLEGLRFRRQHPMGPYVVDFYCPAARLAVELDGEVHQNERAVARDAERDSWLREQGVRVVRIPNQVVL